MANATRETAEATDKKASAKNGPADPNRTDVMALLDAQEVVDEKALDGFEKIQTEVDAFFSPEIEVPMDDKGTVRKVLCQLHCIPISMHERPRDPRRPEMTGGKYYKCVVTKPMLARDENKEVKALKPGQIVWVDQRYDFTILDRCMPKMRDGRLHAAEFFAKPLNKISLKQGRTKWRFDLRARVLSGNELASWGIGNFSSLNDVKQLTASNPDADDDQPSW